MNNSTTSSQIASVESTRNYVSPASDFNEFTTAESGSERPKRLKKYAEDDMKGNRPKKNRKKRADSERKRKREGEGGSRRGGACSRADWKPPRAEITCKNNNGREYRITRRPAFHSVIGFRICQGERKKGKRRWGKKASVRITLNKKGAGSQGCLARRKRERAREGAYARRLHPSSQLSAKIFAVGHHH